MELCRVGLVEVLLGLLDWRAGGRHGFIAQMKWNESEASIGRVLAVEVCICSGSSLYYIFNFRNTSSKFVHVDYLSSSVFLDLI